MSNRFETTLDANLAQLLVEKLTHVLKTEGFREALHLAEPHVWEFQRDSDIVTLQTGHAGSRGRTVYLESESLDVSPLVQLATRDAVLEVSSRLLGALSWVDSSTALQRMRSILTEAMQGSS